MIKAKTKKPPGANISKLQERETFLGAIIDVMVDGLIAINVRGKIVFANPMAMNIFGYEESELINRDIRILMPEKDVKLHEKAVQHYLQTGESNVFRKGLVETRGHHKSGKIIDMELAVEEGEYNGQRVFIGSIRDITQKKKVQAEAEVLARQYRMLADYGNDIIFLRDSKAKLLYVSPSTRRHLDREPEEMLGKNKPLLLRGDDAKEVWDDWIKTVYQEKKYYHSRLQLAHKDGHVVWFDAISEPILDEKGNLVAAVTACRNLTEQMEAEDEKARFGRILEDSLNEIYVFDDKTLNFTFVNRGARKNLGYSQQELHKITPVDIKPEFNKEGFQKLLEPLRTGEKEKLNFETIHLRKDGSTYHVEVFLQLSHTGEKPQFVAIIEDITEKKKAAEQLRQSQKMEAVGQLTGGIAHDFNNLLTAIQGGLQLLEMTTDLDENAQECVEIALRSAKRGAELTHRLLAFSRTRPLNPKVVDANVLLENMLPLLKQTITETVEIETHSRCKPALVEVDVSELESSILNLSINARDAMPEGGKLVIEVDEICVNKAMAKTMKIKPGEYIVLAVSDTGTGMTEEILKNIFDPFFTTKEVGKGSGLGLSMIYGFVKRTGGHISVYSEPGEGTTFKMFLPKAETKSKTTDEKISPSDLTKQEEGLILLVEDDHEVRTFVSRALKIKGYTVLDAEHGLEALKIMDRGLDIDLLLTDIVLPRGMDGREVARGFATRYPKAKILYSSGYTGRALSKGGRLPEGVELLSKPYDLSELFYRISTLLKG
ncbi:MAG: PAS domain S-box protein [Proteobacteria bacterium]|nr:PAS domain S-box protein [Pseudomonadota bacterium]